MTWNWKLPNWPRFRYDPSEIASFEKKFLLQAGSSSAYLKTLSNDTRNQFIVEILSLEGIQSSKIEGEILKQESLQSSIRNYFGFNNDVNFSTRKEDGMAELLCDAYKAYDEPLTHEMLWKWHGMLFKESNLPNYGQYRIHPEPMHIISHGHKIHFEAPPSKMVPHEMEQFIEWYNDSRSSLTILARAAIAHLYFESIHPFEDGNGRIGRVIVEKTLSQGIGHPILIAISKCIEKHKKEYYRELEKCNKTLEVQHWVEFFADLIVQAQHDSMLYLEFLIKKAKMLTILSGKLNPRQEKVLLKMFTQGPDGFVGGLSAEKYIAITKTTRATATRDLADLIMKGALIKTGERRYTRYWFPLD